MLASAVTKDSGVASPEIWAGTKQFGVSQNV